MLQFHQALEEIHRVQVVLPGTPRFRFKVTAELARPRQRLSRPPPRHPTLPVPWLLTTSREWHWAPPRTPRCGGSVRTAAPSQFQTNRFAQAARRSRSLGAITAR
jgi:hypothetical protein